MERIVLHPETPNKRDLQIVAQKINDGALVIFPTDTIYALGCLMTNKPGIEKICKILDKKEKQAKMSLICPNISVVSEYTMPFGSHVFKSMKRYLPGPYTFVLRANNYVQKYFKNNKEEIGIRIPDNAIVHALQEFLTAPLISTSLSSNDAVLKHFSDPDDIENVFKHQVDFLLDGGIGSLEESTVLDCTSDEIELIREGKGKVD